MRLQRIFLLTASVSAFAPRHSPFRQRRIIVASTTQSSSRLPCTQLAASNDKASIEEEEDSSCWNPTLRRAIGTIASAGALETAYLTYNKLTGHIDDICGTTTSGSCGSVLTGPYSNLPGTEIPLAALGFLAYSSVAALALLPILQQDATDQDNRILLTALTTTMGVFSIFLMVLLFGYLKESCVFCVASAIFSISMAKLCWLGGMIPHERGQDGVFASLGGALASVATAVALFTSNDLATSAAVNVAGELVQQQQSPTSRLVADAASGQAPPPISTSSTPRALQVASELQTLNSHFYGAFWCSHCFDQKEALGREAMSKIPYIECSKDGRDSQAALCKEKKIPGYPTWEIGGKLYPGEQALEELEEIIQENVKK